MISFLKKNLNARYQINEANMITKANNKQSKT